MRDGQIWFYEISDFFSNYIPANNITYRGFESVVVRDRVFTAGVFEFPSSFKFTKKFINDLRGYSSDRIRFLVSYESIGIYRHCVIVVLNWYLVLRVTNNEKIYLWYLWTRKW